MKIIYNAFLVDEKISDFGFLMISDKKIVAVELGKFLTQKDVEQKLKSVYRASSYNDKSKIEFIDAHGLTIMPAFIDMHAHFRYPGQTQKEDLDSALNAAKAGGFGTLVLMPNTTPIISSLDAARVVMNEVSKKNLSRVFQSVSITNNFNGNDTSQLDFLCKEEVPLITEDGCDVENSSVMLEAMQKAAQKGIIVSCHCEDFSLRNKAKKYRERALSLMKEFNIPAWGVIDNDLLKNIPQNVLEKITQNIKRASLLLELAEDIATARNILIAQKAGCHIHIAHVSTAKSIQAIREAKANANSNGFKITCEATPHHIALTGTTIPKIFAFVNPPLRTQNDVTSLVEALRDGTVDVISTDHAPHTMEDKKAGSPGFSGLETAYAVCNTVLVLRNCFTQNKLSSLMSAQPARILGLNKGLLCKGYDADFVFVDTNKKWIVDTNQFFSKGKASPFTGEELTGKVLSLFIGGNKV